MPISEQAVKNNNARVHSIAGQWAKKTPASITFDDLVQIGWEAVLTFAKSVDELSTDFDKQIGLVIKRRIIEHLRKQDHLPHPTRRKVKAIQDAEINSAKKLGRQPTPRDIAKEANISLDEYFWISGSESVGAQINTDFYDDDKACHWVQQTSRDTRHTREELDKAISRLHPVRQAVVKHRYFDDMTGRQVAKKINMTPSAVCLHHGKAIKSMRKMLGVTT